MKPAIRVENLCKQYRLGARQDGSYRTLRESLTDTVAAPFRWLSQRVSAIGHPPRANGGPSAVSLPLSPDTFWALKDVSFQVQPGEVVGIIGRNGAGKSTLLKLLSQITEPTRGRIAYRGRFGSLLEVGTGFHPELTGRENVFLNGGILGMARHEIRRKFDEIVAFAGIEEFLDTPVKRYSSGMYVRLAFAVAAHLDPEILVLDEVLAVGDLTFQNKCLGKINEIGRSGRTILFVSHNMAAVEGICTRSIVLESGELRYDGPVKDSIQSYHDIVRSASSKNGDRFILNARINPNTEVEVKEVWITSGGGTDPIGFATGAPLEVHVRLAAHRRVTRPVVVVRISKLGSGPVTMLHSQQSGGDGPESVQGDLTVSCSTSDLLLGPGEYVVRVGIKSGEAVLEVIDDAAHFTIRPTDFFGTGRASIASDGCVVCHQRWQFSS